MDIQQCTSPSQALNSPCVLSYSRGLGPQTVYALSPPIVTSLFLASLSISLTLVSRLNGVNHHPGKLTHWQQEENGVKEGETAG